MSMESAVVDHLAFVIRPATEHDRVRADALLRAAQLPLDGLDERFGEGFAVAEHSGVAIGVAGVEAYGDAGLLRSAVVDPDWRGRGVGEALMHDRVRWAAARGLRELWLLTTTAAGYFPRFGFELASREQAPEELRRSREFVDACPASAVAMRLPIK